MGSLRCFVFEYVYEGGEYCFSIQAESQSEALLKFDAMKNAVFSGEVEKTSPKKTTKAT